MPVVEGATASAGSISLPWTSAFPASIWRDCCRNSCSKLFCRESLVVKMLPLPAPKPSPHVPTRPASPSKGVGAACCAGKAHPDQGYSCCASCECSVVTRPRGVPIAEMAEDIVAAVVTGNATFLGSLSTVTVPGPGARMASCERCGEATGRPANCEGQGATSGHSTAAAAELTSQAILATPSAQVMPSLAANLCGGAALLTSIHLPRMR
mmetsp:Transcript_2122/g.6427  ORF Transcript_2122/g.6427 Transcript_2122/m.6427 type:complete len:210 (-) Transcript_2122:191-820(-)